MDLRELIESLHAYERKVLATIGKLGESCTADEIISLSGLDRSAVMKSLLWLRSKGIIEVEDHEISTYSLTDEGKRYAREGLPERRALEIIRDRGGEISLEELRNELGDLFGVAMSWLRKRKLVETERRDDRILLKITDKGREFLERESPQERLLRILSQAEITENQISELGLREALDELRKRGLIEIEKHRMKRVMLTDLGMKLLELGVEEREEITQLTREMIVSGEWRKAKFRKYDLKAPVPRVYPGKPHPLRELIEEIRKIFLEMGFTEVKGPIVESAFWNFDALFQPQDHPAREMQDTFYLSVPRYARVDEDLARRVKETHETGGDTGSEGWGLEWSLEVAKRTLLRTHTTAVSIRYLSEHREPPVKMFSIDRVFRREKIDYKHLPEFHQCEGIVMDEDVTLRDLMGILKEFYERMGFERIRFRPSYFPYTEPSLEIDVYFPEKRAWIELGGAGIFRPEVVKPLGIDYPVLAWGLGLERLAMMKFGLDDIRKLYLSDVDWLRRYPSVWW